MLAFDTETTGLFLRNGSTTFSIGVYDGSRFRHSTVEIVPTTRMRIREFDRKSIRKVFDAADLLVAHNAQFDIRALCEAGIYDWEEPASPAFWERIVDTQHLAHLASSTDAMSLDSLTRKYLGKEYPEDDALIKVVNKCRALARKHRKSWIIAEARQSDRHPTFLGCGRGTDWSRMDFWLPVAIQQGIPHTLRPELPDDLLCRVCSNYLRADCVNTYDIATTLFAELTERHDNIEELLNLNRQIQHVVFKMYVGGLHVRKRQLLNAVDICSRKIVELNAEVLRTSRLEKVTDTTVRKLLFEDWQQRPLAKTKGGQPKVDAATLLHLHLKAEETLEDLRSGKTPSSRKQSSQQHADAVYHFTGNYLASKKYAKKRTSLLSYLHNSNTDGNINLDLNATGTSTTRFSSSNPNAQNIAKAGNPYEDDAEYIAERLAESPSIRSVFGPPPGKWWVSADYSQLQLRIFAFITGEQEMMDAFSTGWDAHDFVARKIFNIQGNDKPTKAQRRIAKNVNFGFIFGASPKKIEKTAGIPGLWDTVLELFPNAHGFIEQTKDQINRDGIVRTMGDYPLTLKMQVNKWNGTIEPAAHAGVNYIVQGSEGVIVKRAMRLCDDYLSSEFPEGRIVLQVHDELVFEMPKRFPKRHAFSLADCMMQAASELGLHAPVDPELIVSRWDKSVPIIPF